MVAYNLNKVIDVNYYPTEKTERSNFRHRPVGVGVQGLADVFMQLRYPFDSPAAKELNRLIFETIYHAALEQSCELAKRYGPYETFAGSPASKGQLQFDLWSTSPTEGRYDWVSLKEDIKEYGLRNSLLLAPMPTASTSQILGNNECFEPITSNLYSRGTNAGQFLLANKYLQRDLIELGLWSEALKNKMVANNGSIQALEEIPEEVRQRYKTVWEIPQKVLIDMAVDRGAVICQSQSLNLWLEDPTYKSLTTMHYYSWKQGLKTGIYYLRRRARHQAQKFTIEPTKVVKQEEGEVCDMCSA
jgi:ribonucleoside-diphosphate reductase alpha chain